MWGCKTTHGLIASFIVPRVANNIFGFFVTWFPQATRGLKCSNSHAWDVGLTPHSQPRVVQQKEVTATRGHTGHAWSGSCQVR